MSFISPSSVALFKVTIDEHKLYVYEINRQYVEPQEVDQAPIDNENRISFLVKLDQAPADNTIGVANAGINQVISGFGVLSYQGGTGAASQSSAAAVMDYGGQNTATITELNRAITAPYPALNAEYAVSKTSDKTFLFDIIKTPTAPIS